MELERVNSLTVDGFLNDYVAANKPCIITDGMQGWPAADLWTPAYFRQRFGSSEVQIYNDRFDLINVTPLSEYLDEYFDVPFTEGPVPYVRWYTKLKDVDFFWADDVFEKVKGEWTDPYFLPVSDYLLPFCLPPDTISATDSRFPARSVFISGSGAATRLHFDPWGSESILFQIWGDKKWSLYSPDQREFLQSDDREFANLQNPNLKKFPHVGRARPTFEFHLRRGDAIFVPRGWLHEVETVESSISLTWNFVHRTTLPEFLAYLKTNISDHDTEILQFFYSGLVPKGTDVAGIREFVERTAG